LIGIALALLSPYLLGLKSSNAYLSRARGSIDKMSNFAGLEMIRSDEPDKK
jgi:hypothetical protein